MTSIVAEDTVYEDGGDRDARLRELVAQVAVADFEWTLGLVGKLPWASVEQWRLALHADLDPAMRRRQVLPPPVAAQRQNGHPPSLARGPVRIQGTPMVGRVAGSSPVGRCVIQASMVR